MVPLTYWALYRTRFGLRLRAVGENPAAVDTAGISVRGLRYSAVVICGVLVGLAGAYLALAQTGYFQPHMTAGQRLHRAGRAHLRQMAAVAGARDLPAVRLPRRGGDPPAGRRAAGHRPGAGAGDRGAALCPDRRAAGRLHRQGDPAAGRRGFPMSRSADAALADLFAAAKAAQANAYAPYSRFHVGAALRTPDGAVYRRLQCRERRLSARHLRRSRRHRRHGRRGRAAHRRNLRRRRRRGPVHALRRLPPAHPRIRRRGRRSIHVAGPEGVRRDLHAGRAPAGVVRAGASAGVIDGRSARRSHGRT